MRSEKVKKSVRERELRMKDFQHRKENNELTEFEENALKVFNEFLEDPFKDGMPEFFNLSQRVVKTPKKQFFLKRILRRVFYGH